MEIPLHNSIHVENETAFLEIAQDLEKFGYSIRTDSLPKHLTDSLLEYQQEMNNEKFRLAAIGRQQEKQVDQTIRTDKICWITGETEAGLAWLNWTAQLQLFLNRRLFLGCRSFESHFAHYEPGDYYKRHYDAFRGEANRVLSVVTYFNQDWKIDQGGELVLYIDENDEKGIKILPRLGTLVVFLSEEFPHEVLKATKDRYSVAGWFRTDSGILPKSPITQTL